MTLEMTLVKFDVRWAMSAYMNGVSIIVSDVKYIQVTNCALRKYKVETRANFSQAKLVVL